MSDVRNKVPAMTSDIDVLIHDPTLRDGNHAIRHQLTFEQIRDYCSAMDGIGLDCVEVGHGNGLGASSLQLGIAPTSDEQMLTAARQSLKRTKLGVHVIPGFASLRDIAVALDCGVDRVRVATNCSEADTANRYIVECKRSSSVSVHGVLMMSHMLEPLKLAQQARLLEGYGADAIILMDSAGYFVDADVRERVSAVRDLVSVPVGFHGHNNLGLAVSNSLAAIAAGASIIDATTRGFGAGAGNCALEMLIAVLFRSNINSGVAMTNLLKAIEFVPGIIRPVAPPEMGTTVASGLYGVFSGFESPVKRAAAEFNVSSVDIFQILGQRRVLAGQEDVILNVAHELASRTNRQGIY